MENQANNSSATSNSLVVNPAVGYDAVAADYDRWNWSDFWTANEAPYVRAYLAQVRYGTLLDAGCGTGRYHRCVSSMGHHYVGVDVSGAMLEINGRKAYSHIGDPRPLLYLRDLRECPVPSGSMEGVLSTRVLSHLDDLTAAFQEFRRILRSGGLCVITDVHAEHPYEHTTVSGRHGKVSIETYKWTPADVFNSVQAVGGLEVVGYRELSSNELLQKPAGTSFEKLYQCPNKKVFYVLALRKRTTN